MEATTSQEEAGNSSKVLRILRESDNQACDVQELQRSALPCMECSSMGEFTFAKAQIPGFRHAEISSFYCPDCGSNYRKVRSGLADDTGVNEFGTRIKLRITSMEDLSRDILLSDTASYEVPDIDLYVGGGDGAYSTIEGLLRSVDSKLRFMRIMTDEQRSSDKDVSTGVSALIDGLKDGHSFELIVDDPLGESHISSRGAGVGVDRSTGTNSCLPEHGDSNSSTKNNLCERVDENLVIEKYTRTDEVNAELGLVANPYIEDNAIEWIHPSTVKAGDELEALYSNNWLQAVVVSTNDDHSIIWVTEKGAEENGKWHVSLEETRIPCPRGYIPTSATRSYPTSSGRKEMTAEELLRATESYAKHVEAQETGVGVAPVEDLVSDVVEETKNLQIDPSEVAVLEELD